MITTLLGSAESLALVLAGAKTSLDAVYNIVWKGNGGPKSEVGNTNGTTTVTPVTGDGPAKSIETIIINNIDTGAITITISKVVSGTTYKLYKFVLQVGDMLLIDDTGLARVLDSAGQSKSVNTSNLVNQPAGASTAAAGTTTADAGVLPAGTASVYPTTAADDVTGVRVHASDAVTGRMLFIGNGVSNKILKVYAPTGGTINGAAANAAFSSVSGKGVIMYCLSGSANSWLAW